jgi:Trk-type K+ transport system membrane component
MIHDLVLRWVVTALFVLSAADCGLAIIIKHRPWTLVVSHGLHFVMAVAMVVMAWPWGAQFPAAGPALFFLLAAVWFVTMPVVVARTTAPRLLDGYHGLMMLATAWMYAVMDGHLLPVESSTRDHAQPDVSMPDMTMASMAMPTGTGSPIWFSTVNWFGTVGFAVAAVFWTCRHFIERQHEAAQPRSLVNLGQAMMATGMTTLFLTTLFLI